MVYTFSLSYSAPWKARSDKLVWRRGMGGAKCDR
jgi:hypothetical protein